MNATQWGDLGLYVIFFGSVVLGGILWHSGRRPR